MSIPFTKMHGLGNDFVVLNGIKAPFHLTSEQIKSMSDRRYGIGFDQMLIVEPSRDDQADFFYRIFNADGSEAEQCGNGLRCIARYLQDKDLADTDTIRLHCKGGAMEATIEDDSIRVNMGAPIFSPKDIPFKSDTEQLIYNISVADAQLHIGVLSMGNPHAVICVDDLNMVDVSGVGEAINELDLFPQGVNVGFLQVAQPYHALLEVYERGAGPTTACGSGACAAMVYGHKLGILEREVSIVQPGGELVVSWSGGNDNVYMSGPACTTFEGQWI